MTRTVLGWVRLLGIALAVAAGCGGSLGGTGTGGKGSAGAGGAGALALTGSGGLGGIGGGCSICSSPTADVAGCPSGFYRGASCVGSPGSFCCAGSQQYECDCGLGNAECIWIQMCGDSGGATGAGGFGGSGTGGITGLTGGTSGTGTGGVGGDVGGTTGAGGFATGGAGGTGTGGHGGSGGTGSGGQGGIGCGGRTCAAGQRCVHPSCAGGIAASGCMPLPDGGTCPGGWMRTDFCSPTGPGCVLLPCDSPPAFCTDVPAACAGTPTCACLASDICTINGGNGGCEVVTSTDVTCGSV